MSPTMTFSAPKDFRTGTFSSRWTNAHTLSTFESTLIRDLPVLPPAPVMRIIILNIINYTDSKQALLDCTKRSLLMTEKFLEKIFEHNNWSNQKIIKACYALSNEQLEWKPQSVTQGTICRKL